MDADNELNEMTRTAREIVAEIEQLEHEAVKSFCAEQGLNITEQQTDMLVAALAEDRERERNRPLTWSEWFWGHRTRR